MIISILIIGPLPPKPLHNKKLKNALAGNIYVIYKKALLCYHITIITYKSFPSIFGKENIMDRINL